MINASELIRAIPGARRFEVGGMLFAEFTCPAQDQPLCVWSEIDHLVHVLSSRATWETSEGLCTVDAGETVFFRKGAFVLPPHFEPDLCLFIFFLPDAFVREIVREFMRNLAGPAGTPEAHMPVIRVNRDVALSAFLESIAVFFSGEESPSEPLLKLKVRELLTGVLIGQSNPALAAHFRHVAAHDQPSIAAIMEANFRHNLPLGAFAKMCHRSLSTFKRDFKRHYGLPPARWLLERRLDCAAHLLHTTNMSVTDIAFDCGFEEPSHLSRTFKARFGRSPSEFRAERVVGT